MAHTPIDRDELISTISTAEQAKAILSSPVYQGVVSTITDKLNHDLQSLDPVATRQFTVYQAKREVMSELAGWFEIMVEQGKEAQVRLHDEGQDGDTPGVIL